MFEVRWQHGAPDSHMSLCPVPLLLELYKDLLAGPWSKQGCMDKKRCPRTKETRGTTEKAINKKRTFLFSGTGVLSSAGK